MKLQYASDLHLEDYHQQHNSNPEFFKTLLIPQPDVDALILAGDIGHPHSAILTQFLIYCSANWPHTLWVMGNHEYYNICSPPLWKHRTFHSVESIQQRIKILGKKIPRLHILDNTPFVFPRFPDYIFLGTTFWTDLSDLSEVDARVSNDFRYIGFESKAPLQPYNVTALHKKAKQWLIEQLDLCQQQGKKAVVITHHLPTYKIILPQYQDSTENELFASHSDSLVTHPATLLWICGHTHGALQQRVGMAICTYNARGHNHEPSIDSYNPGKTIVLEDLVQQTQITKDEEVEFV
jgi:hypothetical protein